MKLLYTKSSPFARKLLVHLLEANSLDAVELLELHPFDADQELRKYNPLGKIPCLLSHNNEPLVDSSLILEFLIHELSLSLFRLDERNWNLKSELRICDGILEAAVDLRVQSLRHEDYKDWWTERKLRSIELSLNYFEDRVHKLEENLSLAIHLACCLAYLEFRHPMIEWRENCRTLDDWFAVFKLRSSMQSTIFQ